MSTKEERIVAVSACKHGVARAAPAGPGNDPYAWHEGDDGVLRCACPLCGATLAGSDAVNPPTLALAAKALSLATHLARSARVLESGGPRDPDGRLDGRARADLETQVRALLAAHAGVDKDVRTQLVHTLKLVARLAPKVEHSNALDIESSRARRRGSHGLAARHEREAELQRKLAWKRFLIEYEALAWVAAKDKVAARDSFLAVASAWRSGGGRTGWTNSFATLWRALTGKDLDARSLANLAQTKKRLK